MKKLTKKEIKNKALAEIVELLDKALLKHCKDFFECLKAKSFRK